MKLPLKNILRKQAQVSLAQLQDEAVDVMYAIVPSAVLHGGTAIWRCYSGNRFSEGLDFYSAVGKDFEEKLLAESKKRGLTVSKFRKTGNSVYAKLFDGQSEVSLEVAGRKPKNSVFAQYEKIDGSILNIFSLSKEDLIVEKASAFLNRKLIRDVYDVYFLSSSTDLSRIRKEIGSFIDKAPMPVDEKNLKALLYSGATPSFQQMLNAIKLRIKRGESK